MTSLGSLAKGVIDLLTPDSETERLIFRRISGQKLSNALETGSPLKDSDIETVVLKINPQEIGYSEKKITNKVPTASPGKFITFDWGSELLMMTISGSTGMMLPTNMGDIPAMGPIKDIATTLGVPGADSKPTSMPGLDYINMIRNSMSYTDILNMSPKYRAFIKLKDMYHRLDADADILTLEMGDDIHRGFFEDFQFTVASDSPWNWKYSIVFVSIENLADTIKRGDETFPNSDNIDDGA